MKTLCRPSSNRRILYRRSRHDRRDRPRVHLRAIQCPALRGLDFTVERGEIFGCLGPSGAGKSTTQKILIGLFEGYTGRARVRGKEVAAWTADDYERIGVSFETPDHFLKLTGLENLR